MDKVIAEQTRQRELARLIAEQAADNKSRRVKKSNREICVDPRLLDLRLLTLAPQEAWTAIEESEHIDAGMPEYNNYDGWHRDDV